MHEMIQANPMLEEMKRNDFLYNQTIYLDCEVDRGSQVLFCRQLKKLAEQELPKPKKERNHIKIMISSYGGVVYDYYAMASMMEYYKSKGIILETYNMGYSMSAGAKILILGSKGFRFSTRYGSILLHQIQTGQWGGMTMQEKLADAEQLKRDWEVLKSIIKANSKLTDQDIEDFTKNNLDVYYSPEEALEKGLIDKLI